MKAVELDNVTKSFGDVQVIKGVSIAIEKGEFVSLLGPSGCGKTTLLRMIAGLEATTSGAIRIGGKDSTHLPPELRDIAMVFQSYALLPHLSVLDNVMFPLRMRKLGSPSEQRKRAKEALELVQLDHLTERKPRALSGGQQQRVALARAVVSSPQVLLLDEPLSNLDAKLRENMQEELVSLHRKTGLTTVFVTHDQEEALSMSDRIILLSGGEVEQEGAPRALYSVPQTRFAASFMGSTNLVEARIALRDGQTRAVLSDGQTLALAAPAAERNTATIMFRQEDIGLAPAAAAGDGNALVATVTERIFLGSRTRYVLDIGGGATVRCLAPSNRNFEVDEKVALSVSPESILVLDD